MPLVKVFVRKGKSPEYLRLLSDGIHSALMEAAGVPEDAKFHIVHGTPDQAAGICLQM